MLGIIQKTLVECLHQAGGDDLRRAVFREAGVEEDRVFRIDQSYPDTELQALFDATKSIAGLSDAALADTFARVFFQIVNEIFPEFTTMARNSEDLLKLQAKIHAMIASGQRDPTIRKGVDDKFKLVENGHHRVRVQYTSALQLCGFYCALARAAAQEYGDRIEIETMRCRKRNDDLCEFRIRWLELAGRTVDQEFHDPGLTSGGAHDR